MKGYMHVDEPKVANTLQAYIMQMYDPQGSTAYYTFSGVAMHILTTFQKEMPHTFGTRMEDFMQWCYNCPSIFRTEQFIQYDASGILVQIMQESGQPVSYCSYRTTVRLLCVLIWREINKATGYDWKR